MDLGLGCLIDLKEQILPSALQGSNQYDVILQAIGSGVAGAFEKYCNRKLGRVVGDTYTHTGDRQTLCLPRYPIEAVTLVEFRDTVDIAYYTVTGAILNMNEAAGLVTLTNTLGFWFGMTRITWTGGFWYDTAETRDTAQPAGSTKVPADLKLAWFSQCRKLWSAIDKQGRNVVTVGEKAGAANDGIGDVELVPTVIQVLDGYKRFAIT